MSRSLRFLIGLFLILTFLRPANIGQSAEVDWDARTIFDKYEPIVSLWHRDSPYTYDYSVPAFNSLLQEWRSDYPNALAFGDLAWTESNPLFERYRPHYEPPPGGFTAEMVEYAALMAFMDTLMSVEPEFKADRFVLSNMKHFMTFSKLLEFQGEQSEPEFLNELMDAGWADHFVGYLMWMSRGAPSLAAFEDNTDYSRWYEQPMFMAGSEEDPTFSELFALEFEEETKEERQLLAGMAEGAVDVAVEVGYFMGDILLATAVVTSSEGDAYLIVLWADEGGWRGSQITNVHAMRQGQAGQDAVLIATTVDIPKTIFLGIPAGLEEARHLYEIGEHREAGRHYMREVLPAALISNGLSRGPVARPVVIRTIPRSNYRPTGVNRVSAPRPSGSRALVQQTIRPSGSHLMLRISPRQSLLSRVRDPRLRNAIENLYRRNAKIGDGSAMDAVRYEKLTGRLLSRRGHIQKLLDRRAQLMKLRRDPKLNATDKAIIKDLLINIQDALSQ